MSALTFETLSAELTQALSERSTTPPKTVVRCTLGRDKVMVLVEYPLDSAKAEPFAHQTLDWLEQDLRSRFDTTGLPDEVADLSDAADQVAVQLYLKHLSEAKPFTMRLFTWKVGDGFDELFGHADTVDSLFGEGDTGTELTDSVADEPSAQPQANMTEPATAASGLDAGFFSMAPVSTASVMLPEGEEERVLLELEEDSLSLELESDLDSEHSLNLDLDSDLGADFDAVSTSASEQSTDLDLAAEFGLGLGAPSQASLDSKLSSKAALDSDLSSDLDSDLDSDLGSALGLASATEFVPDLSENSGEALDADLSAGVGFTDAAGYPSTEFTLPGEAPAIDSSDLDLPTIDLPIAMPEADAKESPDFFNLVDESEASEPKAAKLTDSLINVADTGDWALDPELTTEPATGSTTEPITELTTTAAATSDAASDIFEASFSEPAMAEEYDAQTELTGFEFEAELAPTLGHEAVRLNGLEEDVDTAPPEAPHAETDDLLQSELFLNEPSIGELPLDESRLDQPVLDESVPDDSLESEAPPATSEAFEATALPIDPFVAARSDSDDLVPDDLSDFRLAAAEMAEREAAESEANPADEPFARLADADYPELDADHSDFEHESTEHEPTEHEPTEYEYEEVTHDYEDYADDPVYYLEDEDASADEDTDEEYEEVVASVDEMEVQRQRELWQQQTKSSGNPMVVVGAVGLLFAGVVGFFLTRPCTVGGCDRIAIAQVKGEEALGNLRIDDSFDAVAESKKELKESILLLEPIPVWSSYYDDAQAILPEYDRQLTALDLVSEAQGKAYSAAVDSQNPPHSVAKWQAIASDWRAATRALSGVPENSPVRELANRKLAEYRSNLSTVLVRIEAESGAEVSLRQAQQAASQATQQTPKANSVDAWEAVLSDWETAVENLQQIPQGTSAYAEAQQLLPEFTSTLQEIRSRAEQERSAGRMLFRAEQLATDAQQAEDEEQWTSAVERWNLAVIQLKDVPEGVSARSPAQSLLTTYTSALASAENNMQVSLRFQPVEPSFFLVCGLSEAQKCSYSMQSGKVRLDLAEGYDSVINESITPPPQRTGLDTNAQLVGQSNQLLQQITLLSTQAQIPVELYDSDGAFLARYRPDLDGFVRQ